MDRTRGTLQTWSLANPSNPFPPGPRNFLAQVHTSTSAQAAGGAQLVPGQYPCGSGKLPKYWPEMGSSMPHPGLVSRNGAYVCKGYVTPGWGYPAAFRAQLEVAGLLVVAFHRFLFSEQRMSFLSCEWWVPFMTASQVQMLVSVCQLPKVSGACAPRLLALLAGIRAYVCFAGVRQSKSGE